MAWRKLILEMMDEGTLYTYNSLIQTVFGRQMAEAVNGKGLEPPLPLWSRAIEELEVLGLIESVDSRKETFYRKKSK